MKPRSDVENRLEDFEDSKLRRWASMGVLGFLELDVSLETACRCISQPVLSLVGGLLTLMKCHQKHLKALRGAEICA